MTSGIINDTTPVDYALTSTRESLAELITVLRDGGLDHHDLGGKLQVLDQIQELISMMQAVDAEVLAGCRDSGVLEAECQRSMAKVLERRCLVGPGEANRRMRAAEAVGPRVSPTGLPLPRLRPRIADAMTVGAINADQVRVVRETLNELDQAGIDPDKIDQVEAELVDHCTRFGPKQLATLKRTYLDTLDPDGPEPDEQRNHDQRNVELRPMASGAYKLEGRLTGELGAKLAAILSPLAKPRVPKSDDLNNTDGVSTVDLLDQRTHGQRMHDALDDAVARLLRSGDLPDSGGTPASVIITTDINDLLTHTQHVREPFKGSDWVCTHCGATNEEPADRDHDDPATTWDEPTDQATQTGDTPQPTSPINDDQDPRNRPRSIDDDPIDDDQYSRDRRAAVGDHPIDEDQQVPAGSIDDQDPYTPSGEDQNAGDRSGPITTTATEKSASSRLRPPGRVRRKRPGHATTSLGATLTIPELLRLANEADIYPVVMTAHGQLLDLGHSRRIANKNQTMALIARDGGCSFPACDHPAEWCERHHITSWLENGTTSVDNLTLLCRFHHHQFLLRGWNVKINNNGLPEWTPPRWIDPEQKPMINNRIIARIHQTTLIDT